MDHYIDNSPNSPSSLLHLMASTSTQVDVFSDGIIQAVKNGEENPLKVLIQLKAMEMASERIKKEIKDNVLTAAEKYPGKEFEFMGNKIVKGDVYTSYDFTVCQDPIFEERESMFNSVKGMLDERKKFLMALKDSMMVLIESTGEMVRIYPPKKTSTPGVKISLK